MTPILKLQMLYKDCSCTKTSTTCISISWLGKVQCQKAVYTSKATMYWSSGSLSPCQLSPILNLRLYVFHRISYTREEYLQLAYLNEIGPERGQARGREWLEAVQHMHEHKCNGELVSVLHGSMYSLAWLTAACAHFSCINDTLLRSFFENFEVPWVSIRSSWYEKRPAGFDQHVVKDMIRISRCICCTGCITEKKGYKY